MSKLDPSSKLLEVPTKLETSIKIEYSSVGKALKEHFLKYADVFKKDLSTSSERL